MAENMKLLAKENESKELDKSSKEHK